MKIGFIGLGHMGLPMAANLLKKGHEVVGYDISPASKAAFLAQGGVVADDLNTLSEEKDAIFTMLQTPEQVLDVCLGEFGVFKSMRSGALYVDCSTVGVETARTLHEEAKKHGLDCLDAPVSGGVRGAFFASLTLMVGGEQTCFERYHELLACLGSTLVHTGGAGTGQAAKLCNNMLLGISMIGVSEAFLLAERLGLSDQKLFDIVTQSSGQCWSMSMHTPVPKVVPQSPANYAYQPGFSTKMMLKDLKLAQKAAESVGLSTALGALAAEIYTHEVDAIGDLDFSAVITRLASRKSDT